MKKINKSIIVILMLISVLVFAACNNNKESKDNDKNVISPIEDDADKDQDTKPTEEPSKEPEDSKEPDEQGTADKEEEYIPDFIHGGEPFDYTQHCFYNAKLDVKAPAYQEVSHGVRNFHYGYKITLGYLAGASYDVKDYGIEKNEDIMDNMLNLLVNGTSRYVYGDFESIEFDSIEKMTINDIEMIRYEGVMTVAEYQEGDNKRYVVAYTFLYNNLPNAIFGVAGDSTQEQEIIDELIHNIDESVKTIVPMAE